MKTHSPVRLSIRTSIVRSPACLALAFAPWAMHSAGGGGAENPFEPDLEISVNGLPSGALGKLLSGNLTPDGVADALVVVDGDVTALYGPLDYRLAIPIAAAARDIALLPGANVDKTDAFLSVGGDGLRTWRWSAATAEFVCSAHVAGWSVGLQQVGVARANGALLTSVVVIDGAGSAHSLLYMTSTGEYFSTLATFPIGPDVGQMAFADWDGDGTQELVVVRDAGLQIWELDGSAKTTVKRIASTDPGSAASDVLGVLGDDPSGLERIVWIENPVEAEPMLTVLDFIGAEDPVELPGMRPAHAAVADVNGDLAPDLCLSLRTGVPAVVLLHQAGVGDTTFDPLVASFALGASSAVPRLAGVVCADIDHDEDVDVLVPHPEGGSFLYFAGSEVDSKDLVASLSNDFCSAAVPPSLQTLFWVENPMLAFLLCQSPDTIPSSANRLAITAFARPYSESPFALSASEQWSFPLPGEAPWTIQAPSLFNAPGDPTVRFVEARLVRQVAGEPPWAYPALRMVLTPSNGLMAQYASFYGAVGITGECSGSTAFSGGSGPPPDGVTGIKARVGGVIIRLPDIPLE